MYAREGTWKDQVADQKKVGSLGFFFVERLSFIASKGEGADRFLPSGWEY
jgi:hypothetical protein